jgi:ATP-dependent RNA helicase RhlE
VAESYVHRIGRTARAGKDGIAISLVMGEEKIYLINIERTTRHKIDVVTDHPYHSESAAGSASTAGRPTGQNNGRSQQRRPRTYGGGAGAGGRSENRRFSKSANPSSRSR